MVTRRRAGLVGPSPRGRGNRTWRAHGSDGQGAIPAWAGKPCPLLTITSHARGHPRVGGETGNSKCGPSRNGGPSPRGRGNQPALHHDFRQTRAIPAWAGKPRRCADPGRGAAGHPRVGGETSPPGSTPPQKTGPSPRGRGNLGVSHGRGVLPGAIPAWAGKPRRPPGRSPYYGGHPRVGGETRPFARLAKP